MAMATAIAMAMAMGVAMGVPMAMHCGTHQPCADTQRPSSYPTALQLAVKMGIQGHGE